MKDVQGRWKTAEAEARYRALEDELWAELVQPGPEVVDVPTAWGPTRAYRWPGEGETVVLLHGIGGTSISWAQYVGRFGGRPLVAIDTMGDAGRSVHERPFADAEAVAAWLDETLAALGVAAVHLVGASLGGWIALDAAIHRPERIASVCAVEPRGIGPFSMGGFLRWGTAVLAASMLPLPARRLAGRRLGMPLLEDRRMMRLARWGTSAHVFRPEPERFTCEALGRIGVPVLVAVGGSSAIHEAPAVVEEARRCLGMVEAVIVPDGTHALQVSHPDEVEAAWLAAFGRSATPG